MCCLKCLGQMSHWSLHVYMSKYVHAQYHANLNSHSILAVQVFFLFISLECAVHLFMTVIVLRNRSRDKLITFLILTSLDT